ncbi:MAG: prolyl oligopeptidase family serine peptidase, partial [Chitinophagaceae bacterium]
TTVGKQLFAHYLKDVVSSIAQYTYQGKKIRVIDLPNIGTIAGFEGKPSDEIIFYSFTSFAIPPSIYAYHIQTGKSTLHFSPTIRDINLKDYETKQIFFTAEDDSTIPMFITSKKGIEMNGNNPTLLYGYGGFNIAITPSFSPAMLYFMSQGGIYAVANIRGGSEYGEKWHKAGMLENKQRVFNDFIDAAKYLINQKYTLHSKLAISGRSNGGLLVAACLTQRPDLFRVALPQVGVLDMLRYHLFTVGWGWKTEYGSSEKENEFYHLYKYSPYHNIKVGASYPATMVVTADHDDRVVPAHSFKFVARLQMAQATANSPIVLKLTSNAGHGRGKPIEKWIDDEGDVLSFMMYYLGMKLKSF